MNVLKHGLLPFIKSNFPDTHRFQQDNDPKHKSKYALEFLKENGVNYWPTPSESPDLNPIEMIWSEMKTYIRRQVKPKTQSELIEGIKKFWRTVEIAKCNRYINHLQKVLPIVITREGRASGH